MGNVTVFCFLASYLVAFALEWTRLVRPMSINRIVMLGFAAAGLLAHSLYLVYRSQQTSMPPLLNSTHDWTLVLAWLAVFVYLIISLVDSDLPLGLFLLPLVLILIGIAYLVSDEPNALRPATGEAVRTAIHGWAMLHATLLMFGLAGICLGLVLSLMYLVQHYRLKHKQSLKGGLTLPSLASLARWNRQAVIWAVILFSAGLLAGVVLTYFARNDSRPLSWSDPVVLVNLSLLAGLFLFLTWVSRLRQPAGRQVAIITACACGLVLLAVFGLQVLTGRGVLDTQHVRLSPQPRVEPACCRRLGKGSRTVDSDPASLVYSPPVLLPLTIATGGIELPS
ncbi:MAG: cytochrome c biogenesis protein CcsA [Planctomycetaceae bacterium]|nr:cytochrome c biogenesis protein CcsA [Planctomycetaceae bacterium]